LLQDYHFEHGQSERRADIRPFTSRRREMGDTVTLFVDRCVMCTRCVRFTREISGTSELMVINRGSHEEIDVFPGFPLANKLAGNVVDLCPVGALCDKDFLYEQRVWFMKKHPGVCTGCSTGCSITVEENQDHVYRLKPRVNPHVNEWWMCDEGRYGYHHVHSEHRITQPQTKTSQTSSSNGVPVAVEWSALLNQIDAALRHAGRLAAVLSPHLTVEEAYLLAKYARSVDPNAFLAVGYIPVVGQDEVFPKGFTIRAEKCPNRRGVEEVVAHFMHRVPGWDEAIAEIETGNIRGAWISGGYKEDWIAAETVARLGGLATLVVQDMFMSPLMEVADFQLPGAAFAEREGSYVNCKDRLQGAVWAVRPPAGVRTEASLLWQLLGLPGMVRSRNVLNEIAGEIAYFSAAGGVIPPVGVDLKVNLLADAAT
jgi:NADH-quinone oxidoreductase subunit G